MPHPRRQFPALPPIFSVQEALAAGSTLSSIRHPSLSTPHYGVRSLLVAPSSDASLHERTARAAADVLPRLRPGEAISHTTALVLYGCPIRTKFALHVVAPPWLARNRTQGVTGHSLSNPEPFETLRGVPIVMPAAAVTQSAGILPLRELVVAIDSLVRPRGRDRQLPPHVTLERLHEHAAEFRGRGAKDLRLAVTLARVGAESRMETLTRLMLEAFGLAEYFTLQVELHDAAGWIGRFDLVSEERRTIVEFDGDQHRTDKAQYAKDIRRLDRARAAGFHVIRLLSDDVLYRPRESAARVASALGAPLAPLPLQPALLDPRG